MRFSRDRTEEVVRAIVHEIRTEKLTFMAGSIAYHAFLSILPLLLLLLAVLQRVRDVTLRDSIVGVMETVLTEEGSGVIQQGLEGADTSVSVLGGLFLVWGSMRIFRGLDTAFSDIYETQSENTFADQLGDSVVLLVTVALAIVAASLVGELVSVDGDGPLATLLRGVLTAVGLFVVFYPMFYIFPDVDVSFVEVVPGTAFTAVGLTVAQVAFLTVKAGSTGGNLIASILLLLSWLYVIGLVVLVGAAINAVLSNRSRDVDIRPVFGSANTRNFAVRSTVNREELLADLDGLAARLAEGEGTVTVEVDGETYVLERPQAAEVDRSNAVFGMDGVVELELRWWPEG